MALCLPRKRRATSLATRPRTLLVASITNHSLHNLSGLCAESSSHEFLFSRGVCKGPFHGRCFSEGSLLGGTDVFAAGRSIAAKPVIIRSFTKTVQPLIPKADHRGAEPLSCPSAGHAAPQPRSAFGSRHRWPARPATAFGIPDECTWVWPRSQHSRKPLWGVRDFGGCWPGFQLRRWRGRGGASTATTGAGAGSGATFCSGAVAHHRLGRRSRLGRGSCNQRRLHETGLRHSHLTGDRGAGHLGQMLPPASKRLVAQPFR